MREYPLLGFEVRKHFSCQPNLAVLRVLQPLTDTHLMKAPTSCPPSR